MSFLSNESYRLIRATPFLKLLLPFCVGIVLYYYLGSYAPFLFTVTACIAIVGLFLFHFMQDFNKLKFYYIKGILFFCICISLGYFITYFNSIANQAKWYRNNSAKFSHALVRLNSELENKPKSIKAQVQVISLLNDSAMVEAKGEAFIYFQKSEKVHELKFGDYFLVANKFQPIQSANNPGSFDYAKYIQRNQIYESAYLRDNDWKATGKHTENLVSVFASGNRWTRKVLSKYITDSTSLGLAEALLVGYRKNMDDDLTQAYSNAGIVHIVAISGMHVALVYNVFKWLLFLLPFFKKRKSMALFLAIVFMWLFACVTGLPASVARAAVMLSFIGIGEMYDRKMSIYNNLALSAFLLLCINPTWLFDVGFQLSYLAVLSLVVFFQPIYNWLFITNKFLNEVWKLIAVTLAAQILTFPLCVYYFHQFPLLFIITNLLAVPATTVIIFAEIALLLFSWISPLAVLLGKAISLCIYYLNQFVTAISELTFAVYNHLQIGLWQVLLFYLFILAMASWLMRKNKTAFVVALTCVIGLLCFQLFSRYETIKQNKFIVFQSQKASTLAFINGEEAKTFFSDSVHDSKAIQKYLVEPAFNALHIAKKNNVNVQPENHIELFSSGGKRIARVWDNQFRFEAKQLFDYVIITKQCKPDSTWFDANFAAKQVVLDGSVPTWKTKKWIEIGKQLGLSIYNVNEKGAFVINL